MHPAPIQTCSVIDTSQQHRPRQLICIRRSRANSTQSPCPCDLQTSENRWTRCRHATLKRELRDTTRDNALERQYGRKTRGSDHSSIWSLERAESENRSDRLDKWHDFLPD